MSSTLKNQDVTLNGITYKWPSKPVVVVCIDGSDPAYIEQGIKDGIIPNIEKFMKTGFYTIADGTVPSFTCPNNMSIVTGAEPAVHGISGNFYLEPETRQAVVMTGPELLRSSTVLAEFAKRGAKIVSITSKDKLRLQLQKGVDISAGNNRHVVGTGKTGFYTIADGTVPSFTCPNNMSIVTGAEPAVHGISGNFYLEPETRQAVVMTGPELLRSSTVLAEFAKRGAKIVSITSKDKLRLQLQKGVDISAGNISFSAQYADHCTLEENGIANALDLTGMPQPDMYSAELSLFVLEAGIQLLEQRRPDILYLSLTDFVQHKYAPGEAAANDFYKNLDDAFSRLVELGATVGLIADHGMNDKANEDGSPNVIWLQDLLDQEFGGDSTPGNCSTNRSTPSGVAPSLQ